ncbi:MAG: hypothetical protein ABIR05_02120 [Luteimonas sp.]
MNQQPVDQHEWDLQERALREERDHVPAPTADLVLDQHRAVARALRQAPESGPPADFARSVALCVEQASAPGSQRVEARLPDPRVELWLLRGLALVFAGATLGAVARYGREWFEGVAPLLVVANAGTTANWLLALLACVGVSWSLDWMRVIGTRRR